MDNTDNLLHVILVLIPEAVIRWSHVHNGWKYIINPNKSIYHLVCWQIMLKKLNPEFSNRDEQYYSNLRNKIIQKNDILHMEYDLIMQAILDARKILLR